MKNINISVQGESPFYYGMKVYAIIADPHNGSKYFRDKCPVCEDSNRVLIKGYDLPCPLCNSSRVRDNAISINLTNYSVAEFILNEIHIKGSEYKTDYKASTNSNRSIPYARWFGFARWGNGYNDMRTKEFTNVSFREVDVEKVDLIRNTTEFCFYSKTDAKKFCKRLHERQKELLDKFNEEHGTNHEYPFKGVS